MEMVLDKSVFTTALNAVEMKGKWFSSTGLISDKLSEFVKIVWKRDEPKRGYHFINANNQTFVDYWIPADVTIEHSAVLEISKARNYLTNMPSGDITLSVGQCALFSCDNINAQFPTHYNHPNDAACDSFFVASQNVSVRGEGIEWGEYPITSGFSILAEDFSKILKSCESVGHGIYKLELCNESVTISSVSSPRESYRENVVPLLAWGEDATVEYTSPVHKIFPNGFLQCHFNDDSLLVLQNQNLLVARAPYVVV